MPKLTIRDASEFAPKNKTPKTSDEWLAYAKANHLAFLGSGISRNVYALDNSKVIKIEKGSNWQTSCEVNAYKSLPSFKHLLAKIIEHGDGWIVAERASSTLNTFDYTTQNIVIDALKKATNHKIGDLHAGNIGFFEQNAQFKIIDYAL